MIYNLVSCRQVIAKIFTDLDLQEESHRVVDFVEWIGEGMMKIGAFPSFVTKVTGKDGFPLLEIDDYQAKLPSDLYTVNQVAYSKTNQGPFYPMRYAAGSFSSHNTMTAPTTVTTSDNNDYQPSTQSGTQFSGDYYYSIAGNWVKTNIRAGYLLISYQAIPTDEDGYPMIPNDVSFFEALYWYVNMKITYPQWKNGQVRDAVYYDAKSSWNYYRKQAYGNAMMPNGDQLESIKNTWIRLIPEINADKNFYSTSAHQEVAYNLNRK